MIIAKFFGTIFFNLKMNFMKFFKSGFVAIIALLVMSFTLASKSKMANTFFSQHKAFGTCAADSYTVIIDLSNGYITYTSGVSVCPSTTDCYSFSTEAGSPFHCNGTGVFCCANKLATTCSGGAGDGNLATIVCETGP
jgi:hypothetical protein